MKKINNYKFWTIRCSTFKNNNFEINGFIDNEPKKG